MTAYVVDENVPIVANDSSRPEPKAQQADVDCRLACVQALNRVVRTGIIIIDTEDEVVQAYRKYLDFRGQPGAGDAFYRHVLDNKYNRKRVRRIKVRTADRRLEALPAALSDFDPADQIFVVLALVATEGPRILNAVDSDYSQHKAALESAGVRVEELCPWCLKGARAKDATETIGRARSSALNGRSAGRSRGRPRCSSSAERGHSRSTDAQDP
jgi:hypothetical protein